MFSQINKIIKEAKSRQRNIYSINNKAFNFIFYFLVVLEIFVLFELVISNFPLIYQVVLVLTMFVVGIILFLKKTSVQKLSIEPYSRKDKFAFLGLHDLSKENVSLQSSDIVPRKDEVKHINEVLEKTIFPQENVKQLLCLTGQSGCGKSTIISFLENEYKDKYQFYNFTCDYNIIDTKILDVFGTNPEAKIAELTYANKVVIILDQFERYFFLNDEKKEKVKALIAQLAKKNSAIIVSLREEYLAEFFREFNMNNIKAPSSDKTLRGIIRPLSNIIEDKASFSKIKETYRSEPYMQWQNNHIKNNYLIHTQIPENQSLEENIENLGVTLFYCENQSDSVTKRDNKILKTNTLRDKCDQLFSDYGTKYFDKHKANPLIEQEIFFHMTEFDQKVRNMPIEELEKIMNLNDAELLERYFDIQLASSNDFFNTSRILYLLSQARHYHITMKMEDIKTGLYIDQFGSKGNDDFAKALKRLEELQLIHRSVENSIVEFEIAHDFIATAFINYSSSNMTRNVKGALDIFLAEYLNENNKQDITYRKKYRVKEQSNHFFLWVSYVSIAVDLIAFLIMAFIYNPWEHVNSIVNPYLSVLPVFVPIFSSIAILYLGEIFDKIIKYYHGPKEKLLVFIYILIMVSAICSVVIYPYSLFFVGICCIVLGLTFMFLLDSNYQETSRNELWNYGFRTAMIGFVYAFGHIMFVVFNPDGFPSFLIFSEAVMLFILFVYSCIAHLTKEYLYARMIDASSERKISKENG